MIRFFSSLAVLCAVIVVFISAVCLWGLFPPDLSALRDVKRSAAETIVPIPTRPSMLLGAPDVVVGLEAACFQTDTAGSDSHPDASLNSGSPVDSSLMVLEPVGNDEFVRLFLQVRKEFDSLDEADNYASDVLPAPLGDRCQIGIKGSEGRERFVLLIGPFATRREASQAQRALTIKKIPTLLIDQDWQLRRFQ